MTWTSHYKSYFVPIVMMTVYMVISSKTMEMVWILPNITVIVMYSIWLFYKYEQIRYLTLTEEAVAQERPLEWKIRAVGKTLVVSALVVFVPMISFLLIQILFLVTAGYLYFIHQRWTKDFEYRYYLKHNLH